MQRLTKTGIFLRKYSLDELSNLWNVLIGDMSLVGPRPLMKEYLTLYDKEQAKRHDICPGITGWAQVNGRNAINWQQKFKLDIWYVNNLSFSLDMKIIFLTLNHIFQTDDVNASQELTMGWFDGNN
jgi:lipopolysaccharide/colanic/teichoic acid biosynthesis glycosyltransferase